MLLESCEVKCKPQSVDLAEILGKMSEMEAASGLVKCSKPGAESDSPNLRDGESGQFPSERLIYMRV